MILKQKQKFLIKFFTSFTLILLPLFFAQALIISPQIIEFRTNPGKTTEHMVKIKNNESAPTCFELQTENIESMLPDGAPVFLNNKQTALASWVALFDQEVCLKPNEFKTIKLLISIPAVVDKNSYYAAAFFSPVSLNKNGQDNAVSLINRIGVLIAARIDTGTTLEQGNVSKFFYNKANKSFEFDFSNEGNVHLRPYGSIVLKNKKGETVETMAVNQEGALVLPQSARRFTVPQKKQLFGKITATLQIFYGTGPKSAVSTITIAFPEIKNKNSYLAIVLPLVAVSILFGRQTLKRRRTYV